MNHPTSDTAWPRRVPIEIREKHLEPGYPPYVTAKIPDWSIHSIALDRQDVPVEVWDQPIGAIVYATLNFGPDGLEYPLMTNWEWPGRPEADAVPPLPEQVINDATAAYRAALVDHCNEDMHTRYGDLCNNCTGSAALNVPYSTGRDQAVHAAMQTVWAAAWKENSR